MRARVGFEVRTRPNSRLVQDRVGRANKTGPRIAKYLPCLAYIVPIRDCLPII